MDPVTVIEGAVTDLPRDDVDTDQIIPARYMKRVEKTGFGEFCFHEWRANGLDLPPNPILVSGGNLRCGSRRQPPPGAPQGHGLPGVGPPAVAGIFPQNRPEKGAVALAAR